MPTLIGLDISLSMQREISGRDNSLTYHQLALKGISQLLEHLSQNSKMEYVALVTYSTTVEIKVDFTRDYDQIRQTLKKVEAGDKACLLSLLKSASTILNNWSQSCAQLIVFTDCGIGFGNTSLPNFLATYAGKDLDAELLWLPPLKSKKINFVCLGLHSDGYFTRALGIFQQLIDFLSLKGQLYIPKQRESNTEANDGDSNTKSQSSNTHSSHKSELGRSVMFEMIERLCEGNFKAFEATLKIGGYFRLESPVLLWPPPTPYRVRGATPTERSISSKLEVCGFMSLTEIGSPASFSRHLLLPKIEREKHTRRSSEKSSSSKSSSSASSAAKLPPPLDPNGPNYEFEKLEQEIRDFYNKEAKDTDGDVVIIDDNEGNKSSTQSSSSSGGSDAQKESVCVLLHSALKMENLAALVLLADNWYGFLYSYADSKKKSNLMLNILTPGCTIPWLGPFDMLGFAEDLMPGESCTFPVKAEKRSYSQSCVVWIRHVSLQSDVQKVLRHAKKMPEKTQHFYKELNRIRRAALSIGFVELLEAMALLFEKEAVNLAVTASPECIIQLKHAAIELRKPSNRDLKVSIVPVQP